MDLKNYQKRFLQSYQLRTDNGGKYIARCDGESAYLYDIEDYSEVTKFRDLAYASQIKFSEDGKLLAVKSIEPELAVYDLEQKALLFITRFENTSAAQDGKLCFSPDNQYLYNIVSFNDGSSAIARIDIKKQSHQIIFQFENCRFEDAEYLPWRGVFLFGGLDQTAGKYFVLEYGAGNDKFRRVTLDREYEIFVSAPELEAFIAVSANKIYILAGDYFTPLKVLTPVDDATKHLNFFNIITESPTLYNIFSADKEEYDRMKSDSEKDKLEVPVEGDITAVALSRNLEWIFVATNNALKIFDFQKSRLIKELKFYNIADISFGPADKTVLIGTWNYGYVYNTVDLLR
jgi:WD40 repeat protein